MHSAGFAATKYFYTIGLHKRTSSVMQWTAKLVKFG